MNKRIKYEETETHLKLWVDGVLFANIVKKGAEALGFTPFQYLCMTINSQVIQPDAPRSKSRVNYIWEIWLAELLEDVYLPMDCPNCGRRRLLYDGVDVVCEKCETKNWSAPECNGKSPLLELERLKRIAGE